MVSTRAAKPQVLVFNWRDLHNPLAGGGEIHVWRVFQEAARRGWDVQAICSGYPGAPRDEIVEGIPVHRCGTELTYAAALPQAYWRVRRAFRPDLVFEVMDKLPLMTPLYVREPSVCFLHHFFGSAASLEVSKPIAWAVQSAERVVPFVYASTPFTTGSPSATQELVTMGVPEDHVDTVCYGVEQELLGPVAKSVQPSIVYVGRLRRYKHVDHILRAAAVLRRNFPHLRVDIVGRGDAEQALRSLAQSLGLGSCVRFHGYVTEEEKQRLVGSAWVACLPSRKEGFGLSIPEAALCGTPTVGYDVPGVCDAIDHEVTGLLASYPDETALTRALGNLLSNRTCRDALAENAAVRYANFTWENAAARTLAVLERRLYAAEAIRFAEPAAVEETITEAGGGA